MKYMIVKESLDSGIQISVQRATQLLGVSRCGFYKWLRHSKTRQVNAIPDMDVRNEIQRTTVEFPAYGYRRITAELRNRGYSLNHKRVLRLMREDNLLCVRKDFKPRTTDSRHDLRIYPNLVKGLKITRLNRVWACIEWNLDRSLHTELALKDVYNKKRLHSAIRVPLSHRLREGKGDGDGDGNGKGGESIESFKYYFLTSCILQGRTPMS